MIQTTFAPTGNLVPAVWVGKPVPVRRTPSTRGRKAQADNDADKRAILKFLKEHGPARTSEVRNATGCKSADSRLDYLVAHGLATVKLTYVGRRQMCFYDIAKGETT